MSFSSQDELDFVRYSVIPPSTACAAQQGGWYAATNGQQTYCTTQGGCPSGCGPTGGAWIGLFYNVSTSSWLWTDGTPVTYSNWNCNASVDVVGGGGAPFAMMSSGGALVNMYTMKPASPTITPTSATLNPAANAYCNAAASYLGLWSNTGFCSSVSPSYPYAQAPGTAPSPYSTATGAVAYGKFMDGGAAKACIPGSTVFTAETSYQGTNYNCPANSAALSYVCKVPV